MIGARVSRLGRLSRIVKLPTYFQKLMKGKQVVDVGDKEKKSSEDMKRLTKEMRPKVGRNVILLVLCTLIATTLVSSLYNDPTAESYKNAAENSLKLLGQSSERGVAIFLVEQVKNIEDPCCEFLK